MACVRALLFNQLVLQGERCPTNVEDVRMRGKKLTDVWKSGSARYSSIYLPRFYPEQEQENKLEEKVRDFNDFGQEKAMDQLAKNADPLLQFLRRHERDNMDEKVKKFHKDIEDIFDRGQHVANVALWNRSRQGAAEICNRLDADNGGTHRCAMMRYQCVLYNANTIKGLYPVDRKYFWQKPRKSADITKSIQKLPEKSHFTQKAMNITRLGYKFSDNMYEKRLLLAGKGGFSVHHFCIQAGQKGSVVNRANHPFDPSARSISEASSSESSSSSSSRNSSSSSSRATPALGENAPAAEAVL
eukprot:g5474.t1